MRGVRTHQLRDGTRICLSADAVNAVGAATLICEAGLGHLLSDRRIPVIQHGREIGTLPEDFDPTSTKRWRLYDPRPGDFTPVAGCSDRRTCAWIASRTLRPGDLESIPEFRRGIYG